MNKTKLLINENAVKNTSIKVTKIVRVNPASELHHN